jgi:hypothetical protein
MRITTSLIIGTCFILMSCKKEYTIIKKEEQSYPNRATITVELPTKKSEQELRSIANQIKDDNDGYDQVFIFFRLPNSSKSDGAWASAQFKPDLSIEINGVEDQEDNNMLEASKKFTNSIGKWRWDRPYSERIYILYVNSNDSLKLKQVLPDGSDYDESVAADNYKNPKRIDLLNGHGEYMMIEENGNLGIYSNETGKASEAIRIQ